MEDNYRHKGLRKKLLDILRQKGIKNETVLAAMDRVPRHWFMDTAFLNFAYEDKAFPIGAGQTISQPYTVAFQTDLLDLKKGEKVLEVGTGSGYQTCVLVEMGVKVFSIERQRELYQKTKKLLEEMNYRPRLFYGDGYAGLPAFEPFDKIIVTAGAPYVPPALIDQLKPGGRLVIPVGQNIQEMMLIKKGENGETERETFGEFRFVPLLEDKENGE
ncbi:MAG: protein-L-isoaspartate(D-aspartate) O-methyltransferase [Flavobacteriales bacterium]|nr:protein-L-isoaspartate(D-aspartate) O-methyltransferase [Flavobacteriales bacterium]